MSTLITIRKYSIWNSFSQRNYLISFKVIKLPYVADNHEYNFLRVVSSPAPFEM